METVAYPLSAEGEERMKVILSRKYKKDAMEIDIRAFESCLHGHPGARGYFVEDGRMDDGGEFTVVRFYWPPKEKNDDLPKSNR